MFITEVWKISKVNMLACHILYTYIYSCVLTVLHVSSLASDFFDANITITISPGDTSAVVSIPIIDDNLVEREERFVVVLQPQGNGITVGTPGQAVVVIVNDDGGLMHDTYLNSCFY